MIDYQNIHLTANGRFGVKGHPVHETLIHPLFFAFQVLDARQDRLAELARRRGGAPPDPVELGKVSVHRGLPSNKHNPNMYRRNQAQKSEWTRDRRVEVNYRPLGYFNHDGEQRVEEKGVDVLIALEMVRSADRGTHDLIILASHDTDLEPALDAALESGLSQIETAGWHSRKRIKPTHSPHLWHTFLNEDHFERSRDRKDYR